jgi:hypothetical protein
MPSKDQTISITIRCSPELVRRLDRAVSAEQLKTGPETVVTRSALIKKLIAALPDAEGPRFVRARTRRSEIGREP